MNEQSTLVRTLLEIERHVGASGWDRPPQLYALVDSAELASREPTLAERLGLADTELAAGRLTPIEQEALPDAPLGDALARIEWPAAVRGCALVQEVVTLPPAAEASRPTEADAADYAATHPDRQEIRLAVGVLRDGSRAAAARVRDQHRPDSTPAKAETASHDANLVVDADLAPALAAALLATLH